MEAYEIVPGLWGWTGRHERIGRDVGSVYLKVDRDILLIDPVLPPEDTEGFWRALDRDVLSIDAHVHVLLTRASHTRNAREMLERYPRGRLWAPRDEATAVEEHGVAVSDPFDPGDRLPGGVEAHPSGRPGEVVYWLPAQRTLVTGDAILVGEDGVPALCPEKWLPPGTGHAELLAALVPLLELGPERLLPAHGEPLRERAGDTLRALLAT